MTIAKVPGCGSVAPLAAPVLGTPTVSGSTVTIPVTSCAPGATVSVTASTGFTRTATCGGTIEFTNTGPGSYTFNATQSLNGQSSPLSNTVSATVGATVAGNNGTWVNFKSTFFTSNTSSTLRPDAADRIRELLSHGITNIYLQCGWPSPAQLGGNNFGGAIPDNMIGLNTSPAQVAALKNLMTSIAPGMKLHAWFGTFAAGYSEDGPGHWCARVDLTNAAMRSAAIAAMMNVANYSGFDGVYDDTEDTLEIGARCTGPIPTGGLSRLGMGSVNWNNEFADAAHASGKVFAAYIGSNWQIFNNDLLELITQPDFIVCASNVPFNATRNAEFFANVRRPVIFNPTAEGTGGASCNVINNQFNGLGQVYSSVAPQIAGYGLYHYDDSADRIQLCWSAWDQWRAAHPDTAG